MDRLTDSRALDDLRDSLQLSGERPLVIIGTGSCGEAAGSKEVISRFTMVLAEKGISFGAVGGEQRLA